MIYTIYLGSKFWRRVRGTHLEFVDGKVLVMDEKVVIASAPAHAMVLADDHVVKIPHNKY